MNGMRNALLLSIRGMTFAKNAIQKHAFRETNKRGQLLLASNHSIHLFIQILIGQIALNRYYYEFCVVHSELNNIIY